MFSMTVEKQINLNDRTLLLGKPKFDKIPKQIVLKGKIINVLGISNGPVPPFISLEIEQIEDNVIGETLTKDLRGRIRYR